MTSGWFRSSVDLDIECVCGFTGLVPGTEDRVSGVWLLTYTCPGCGQQTEEELGDVDD